MTDAFLDFGCFGAYALHALHLLNQFFVGFLLIQCKVKVEESSKGAKKKEKVRVVSFCKARKIEPALLHQYSIFLLQILDFN